MKEIRNQKLVDTIKNFMPNVGHVKIATKDGRKASFIFRGLPFIASSRLVVKEAGIGRLKKTGIETKESIMLSKRLRTAIGVE
jgi:hypothetical protein